MAKEVFRKSALDKVSSPDQLDKVLKVTSPMSWLALLGITLIIVFVVAWSIVGSLPSTISATGVIVRNNTSTNTILSTQRGTVQRIAKAGSQIYNGTAVLELSTATGTEEIRSNFVGTVTDVLVKPGQLVDNGTEILRVKPAMTEDQKEMVVCYVPISDVDKIKRGMEVTVSLTSADSNSYGHMTGRVVNIDTWATSQKGISTVAGEDNNMVNVLLGSGGGGAGAGSAGAGGGSGGICAVSVELVTDPSTASGYAWSNDKGKNVTLDAPQMCSVRIVTERVPPITKLFAKLKDIWENK